MIQIAKIQFNPFGENTYILSNDSHQAMIVDCGCSNERERQTLVAFIEKNGLQPILVVSTHGHIDHTSGAAFACTQWNVPFAMHSADLEILHSNLSYATSVGFEFDAVPPIGVDLASTTELMLGEDPIRIVLTPGHTPGGVCLYIEPQGYLICGDTLFKESIGRTDLPGGDYTALMNSIIRNILPLGGGIKAFPGHGPDTTLAHEAMYNPFITEVMQGEVNYK